VIHSKVYLDDETRSLFIQGGVELNSTLPYLALGDHIDGFDQWMSNPALDRLERIRFDRPIYLNYKDDGRIKQRYSSLDIRNGHCFWIYVLENYRIHPEINFKNFLCSFNGSPSVGRILLCNALHKWQWFNPETCTKNWILDRTNAENHIQYLGQDRSQYLGNFLVDKTDHEFYNTRYTINYAQFNHSGNIKSLENILTSSFVNLIGETQATSYYPFHTEKFLYSVATRGLFLVYGQPDWYKLWCDLFGFRLYDKIFDYSFDTIQNPLERLLSLMSMLSRFSHCTTDEWLDLYQMEMETIEYNYDHYFSGNFRRQFESICHPEGRVWDNVGPLAMAQGQQYHYPQN